LEDGDRQNRLTVKTKYGKNMKEQSQEERRRRRKGNFQNKKLCWKNIP
jgi:hypothetical protein